MVMDAVVMSEAIDHKLACYFYPLQLAPQVEKKKHEAEELAAISQLQLFSLSTGKSDAAYRKRTWYKNSALIRLTKANSETRNSHNPDMKHSQAFRVSEGDE